jgi:pilus assembly protein Flp/PilA
MKTQLMRTFQSEHRLWRETKAQDMIEYALLAGFVAVGAGAVLPDAVTSISTIFSTVADALVTAVNAN